MGKKATPVVTKTNEVAAINNNTTGTMNGMTTGFTNGQSLNNITGNTSNTTAYDPSVQNAQHHALNMSRRVLDPYFEGGDAMFNADEKAGYQGVRDLNQRIQGDRGTIGGADIQQFLNPYTQNVVDTTNSEINRQGGINANAIRGRQAAASAFGGSGSRAALGLAQNDAATQRNVAQSTAQLMSSGYDKATATALANRANQTGMYGVQGQALEGLIGVGNQQRKAPMEALQQLQAMTPQVYGSTQTGTSNQQNVGTQSQNTVQNTNQNTTGSVNGTTNTTGTQTQPGQSPFQQILGVGATLGGAFLGGPAGASIGGGLANWFKK